MENEKMRPREVARKKGRPLHSVYLAIWDGKLIATKDDNGQWWIDPSSVEAWEKKRG